MNQKTHNKGFILIEAIAAVVILSVSLTLIAGALLTNSRTHIRFIQGVEDLFIFQNAATHLLVGDVKYSTKRLEITSTNQKQHLIANNLTLNPVNIRNKNLLSATVLNFQDATIEQTTTYVTP